MPRRRTLLALALAWGAPLPLAATPAPSRAPRRPVATRPLVMLDPGHGGKDPGAIGLSGSHEKRLVLAAALELRRALERGGRLRVAMTRASDRFVPLEARVRLAQARGAALFVSVHADAADSRAVRGASVYTLGAGASDALAAELARRENRADRFAAPHFRDVSPEVARILASLVRRETAYGSVRLARTLVAEFDRAPDVPLLTNPHRRAGFVVLQAPDIPSVLVELGFLSNAADEARLRRPAHRRALVAAMARAIETHVAGRGTAA
jgi:N-acetylmuramoyl-L-alanine amidase